MKTIEQNFIDWEANVFGFGYGTGENYTIPALVNFFGAIGTEHSPNSYDYKKLEAACGVTVAWLLINTFCSHPANIIEYGSSPRFAWLTPQGIKLKEFLQTKTTVNLIELCISRDEDYIICYPDACNCGPKGYQEGIKCPNPFWCSP